LLEKRVNIIADNNQGILQKLQINYKTNDISNAEFLIQKL